MTIDEILTLADQAGRASEDLRAELDALQPRTTRQQWQAWDCLRDAAACLRSAAVHLSVHDEKTKETS